MKALDLLRLAGLIGACVAAIVAYAGIAFAQPEITESNIENGDVLDEPPSAFNLCFSEPVNTEDQPTGDDDAPGPWRFAVTMPNERQLGLRVVFRSDGECVDVEPGIPDDAPEGVWTLDWMVRSQDTNEESSGSIVFRVGEGEPPEAPAAEGDDGDDIWVMVAIAAGVVAVVVLGGYAGYRIMAQRRSTPDS